jgi:hypothetical protein
MNIFILGIFILIVILVIIISYFYYYPIPTPKVELKTHIYEINKTRENIFNPSIVEWNGQKICSARLRKKDSMWQSYNIYTNLDDKLKPTHWKIFNIPIPKKYENDNYQYEDMRLFHIQNRLFSIQSFASIKGIKLSTMMTLAEWEVISDNNESQLNLISVKHYDEIKGNQKNWFLFEKQGKIFMVTDFSPFRYYEMDPLTFELSNKKEWEHGFKNFRGCKIYDVQNNRLKCMAHTRVALAYYNFGLFEVDLENKKVNQITPEMSLRRYHGLMLQYPHMFQKIQDKYYLTVGIEDNQSMILEWKDVL